MELHPVIFIEQEKRMDFKRVHSVHTKSFRLFILNSFYDILVSPHPLTPVGRHAKAGTHFSGTFEEIAYKLGYLSGENLIFRIRGLIIFAEDVFTFYRQEGGWKTMARRYNVFHHRACRI